MIFLNRTYGKKAPSMIFSSPASTRIQYKEGVSAQAQGCTLIKNRCAGCASSYYCQSIERKRIFTSANIILNQMGLTLKRY